MTQKRRDSHSTEFGLWLREQTELDSKLGYVATNIDYIWYNYKNKLWMLIEEKRYGGLPRLYQKQLFKTLHRACRSDPNYRGIHLLVFENTSPDDGLIWWDKVLITKEQLINKLRFL
jgi:hypothetical protein